MEIKTRKPKIEPRRLLLLLWLKALDASAYNEELWREMESLVTEYLSYEHGTSYPGARVGTDPMRLLHTLWTAAVDTPNYLKAEWYELEVLVLRYLEHESAAASMASVTNSS